MIIEFLSIWFVTYCMILFCMSLDNICWISASPEYGIFKDLSFFKKKENTIINFINVGDIYYKSKLDYILRYRIWSVLTHPRDIIPAIFTSLLCTILILLKGGILI